MARVKRGVVVKARHKRILSKAKGYYGARHKLYRVAKQAVIKAGQYAYRDRRQRRVEAHDDTLVARASVSSARCGSPALMRRREFMDCPIAALSMV